jgi:hypothetical protein
MARASCSLAAACVVVACLFVSGELREHMQLPAFNTSNSISRPQQLTRCLCLLLQV